MQAHIRQILQEVQPYEQMTATGNETVDILLGEKLARCQQAQIACTITMDGKLLNFIQPIDLASFLATPWTTPSKPALRCRIRTAAP